MINNCYDLPHRISRKSWTYSYKPRTILMMVRADRCNNEPKNILISFQKAEETTTRKYTQHFVFENICFGNPDNNKQTLVIWEPWPSWKKLFKIRIMKIKIEGGLNDFYFRWNIEATSKAFSSRNPDRATDHNSWKNSVTQFDSFQPKKLSRALGQSCLCQITRS